MNIRDRMLRGAFWTVLYRMTDRSLGVVSIFVLAHLLMPADFGVVAMATSLYAMLELVAYFGLDIALLREQETTQGHYHCVWTLNVLCGFLIAALMLTLAIPAADFYRDPRAAAVIAWLALAPVLQGFENVGVVNFRKEMRFDREFHFMFAKRMLRFLITIAVALSIHSYWALVVGILVGRASGVVFSFVMQPFRPHFSLRGIGDLMHFSKWLMLHNALSFIRNRSSNFVIGRLAGAGALGLFSVAAEISDLPGTELVAPINRAVMPAYMKLANDLPALRREYLSVLSMVALVAIPAVAGTALCAPFVVILFLGQKWAAAGVLIEILAFYGITRVIQTNAYAAYLALGKPEYFVGMTSIYVSILIALLIYLTQVYGLPGAAWAYVIASAVGVPLDFYFITRFMGVRPMGYVASLWRPISSAGLMYLAVRSVGPPLPGITAIPAARAAYSLALYLLIGVPAYILADLLFWVVSGRPTGAAEAIMLRKARALVSRVSSFAWG
jgi:lipopolysaccharide exporter